MLDTTRDAAYALIDDLEYLRSLFDVDLSPADVRRLAPIARRLLLDADLPAVAAPRIGKLIFPVMDIKAAYRSNDRRPFKLFAAAHLRYQGDGIGPTAVGGGGGGLGEIAWDRLVDLRLDNFVAQRVICFDGQWATRKDVIQYVSYVLSGVHSQQAETKADHILTAARGFIRYSRSPEGVLRVEIDNGQGALGAGGFEFSRRSIDLVLFELMSALSYVTLSPSVIELEAYIRAERGF